jgi:hypothetical protein
MEIDDIPSFTLGIRFTTGIANTMVVGYHERRIAVIVKWAVTITICSILLWKIFFEYFTEIEIGLDFFDRILHNAPIR